MEWEYKVRTLNHGVIIDDVLNKLGSERWELVNAVMQFDHVVVYMKRPKKPDNYGK